MKYIFLIVLVGCSSYPKQHIGMVHDYVLNKATDLCQNDEGLHYIVSKNVIEKVTTKDVNFNDYPCTFEYFVRCQNQKLYHIQDGIGFCFIPESQLNETLEGK